jgi:hypothetical protein
LAFAVLGLLSGVDIAIFMQLKTSNVTQGVSYRPVDEIHNVTQGNYHPVGEIQQRHPGC